MGESRGRAACRLLLELNPDVRGQHVDLPLERLLDTEPDRLLAFSVVVATDLTDRSVLGERDVGSLVCVYRSESLCSSTQPGFRVYSRY